MSINNTTTWAVCYRHNGNEYLERIVMGTKERAEEEAKRLNKEENNSNRFYVAV